MEALKSLIRKMGEGGLDTDCEGIHGLLFLPAGSLVSILLTLIGLISLNIQTLYSEGFMGAIADYPGLRESMISQTLILMMQCAFVMHVSFLFFRRKRELPRMIIAFITIHLLVMVANVAWIASVYNDVCISEYSGVAAAVMMTVFGIPYFMKSKRVKATFVNP